MNPHQGNSGGSLPSFQTFLFGQHGPSQQIPNPGYRLNGIQQSSPFDFSGIADTHDDVPTPSEPCKTPTDDKQSLYYKECLPNFASFANYPPIPSNQSNHMMHHNPNEFENYPYKDDNYYRENFYSSKLNEMSQKPQVKTEPQTNHYSMPTCQSDALPNHQAFHQYNSQYMNCIPPSMMSPPANYHQNYSQNNIAHQYDLYRKMKSEEMFGNSYPSDHSSEHLGHDDGSIGDLDSIILKRKKPSSDSKRAKKLKGGVEDCNYELCNLWHELANPTESSRSKNYVSEKSLSSFSSDSNSQIEANEIKKESCESENVNGNSCGSINDVKPVSKPFTIFNYLLDDSIQPTCRQFLEAEKKLCQHLKMISFGEPVSHIYNPLVYAFETHLKFLKTFCTSDKSVLFLAMNPGPFGMSQNGVPFGEVTAVRDWFQIKGAVQKPAREHPKRCITGLDCQRSEVSGSRFWGFFKKLCGTPEVFFQHCFVHNFCPLAFMSPTGRNITPPELRADQRNALNHACEVALYETLQILNVKIIVCIGKFVESRVQTLLKSQGNNEIRVERITHPSPINPAANKGWDDMVYQQLKDIGIMPYFNRTE